MLDDPQVTSAARRSAKTEAGVPTSAGRLLLLVALVGFTLLVLRRAWVGDDAFITLRTIDNFVAGYGLRFNVDERVQAYTHPLWMFILLLGYKVTHEASLTAMAFGGLFTGLSLWLLLSKLCSNIRERVVAVALLSLSAAFVDYSTSGLENPLTHVLLLLAFWRSEVETRSAHRSFQLSLLTALLGLSRPDVVLLTVPLWIWSIVESENRKKSILWSIAGASPLLFWGLFSVVYYGTPLPNTAISKLGHGLPWGEVLGQGVAYYVQVAVIDPMSLAMIAMAVVLAFRRTPLERLWMYGAGLYGLYILRIGGGHMVGRFITPIVLASTLLLARSFSNVALKDLGLLAFGAHVLAYVAGCSPLTIRDEKKVAAGLRDERAAYHRVTLRNHSMRHFDEFPDQPFASTGRALRDIIEDDWSPPEKEEPVPEHIEISGVAGMRPFFAGPALHFIDRLALTDPLLARLPTVRSRDWRIGHFQRRIPSGYVASIAGDTNAIVDPQIKALYKNVRLATRGKIWTRERWRAIWNLNTGKFSSIRKVDYLRRAGEPKVQRLGDKKRWRAKLRNREMIYAEPIRPQQARKIEIEADSSAAYDLFLLDSTGTFTKLRVDADLGSEPGTISRRTVPLPKAVIERKLVAVYAVVRGDRKLKYRTYEVRGIKLKKRSKKRVAPPKK